MKKKSYFSTLLLAMLLISVPFTTNAQILIGGAGAPQEFSVLELLSNDARGLRLPRMTEEERDIMRNTQAFRDVETSAAVGLMIYNLDERCVEFWNGSRWISLCCGDNLTAQETIPLTNPFVGAFWRNNQQGERLIRMGHPNANCWTATALDPWIKLDTHYVPLVPHNPNAPSQSIIDANHRLPDNAGHRVRGRGDEIYFRIGLRTANNPAENPRPRYTGAGLSRRRKAFLSAPRPALPRLQTDTRRIYPQRHRRRTPA